MFLNCRMACRERRNRHLGGAVSCYRMVDNSPALYCALHNKSDMGETNNQADKDREPEHLIEAIYWLAHRRSINAVAEHFKHTWLTVEGWRVNENWDEWSRIFAESIRDAYIANLANLSDSVRDFFSVGGTIATAKDAIAALKLIQSELGGASTPDKVTRVEISTGDNDQDFSRIIADPELARKLQDLASSMGCNSGDVSGEAE